MKTSDMPESSRPVAIRGKDVRHLIVFRAPSCPQANLAFFIARDLARREIAAGDHPRLVLITNRTHDLAGLPMDLPIDVLPVFTGPQPGRTLRISREVFSCIFSFADANTLLYVHGSRHPIIHSIIQYSRSRGIQYRIDIGPAELRLQNGEPAQNRAIQDVAPGSHRSTDSAG